MIRIFATTALTLCLLLFGGCKQGDSSGKESDYETTKKMVLDILKSDDGKKAIVDMMSDEKIKKQLVIASDIVQDAIDNVLTSEKGAEMWARFFENPTFVENFAESMSDEQKKLIKSLMNDADYQKQMLELLQNPEITQQILSVMKGQQFREHLEKTVEQTLETPLFQSKITETLLKAAEKQGQSEEQSKENDAGQQDSNGEGQDEQKSGTESEE